MNNESHVTWNDDSDIIIRICEHWHVVEPEDLQCIVEQGKAIVDNEMPKGPMVFGGVGLGCYFRCSERRIWERRSHNTGVRVSGMPGAEAVISKLFGANDIVTPFGS